MPWEQMDMPVPEYAEVATVVINENQTEAREQMQLASEAREQAEEAGPVTRRRYKQASRYNQAALLREWTSVQVIPDWMTGESWCHAFDFYVCHNGSKQLRPMVQAERKAKGLKWSP